VGRIQFAYTDSACVVATLDNVCVIIWKGECTMDRSNEWIHASYVLARRLGTPIAVISIITDHAPGPSVNVRAAQSRFLEGLSRTAVAAGATVDGVGFRASFVRAVVAGVVGLARYKCPFKVAATDAEMATWLDARFATLPAGAVRPTARELHTLFADVREQLHGQEDAARSLNR
jgi:hypothetical protein